MLAWLFPQTLPWRGLFGIPQKTTALLHQLLMLRSFFLKNRQTFPLCNFSPLLSVPVPVGTKRNLGWIHLPAPTVAVSAVTSMRSAGCGVGIKHSITRTQSSLRSWKTLQMLLFWITSVPKAEANVITWEKNLFYSDQNKRCYSTEVVWGLFPCGTLCPGEISFFSVLSLILPLVISPWQHFGPITEHTIKIPDF